MDVEIQGITEGGVLHLAIYSSKEVFESDRGDNPGSQPGIEAGTVENIGKGAYRRSFEIPPGTYAIGVYIDENEMESLIQTFLAYLRNSTDSLIILRLSVSQNLKLQPLPLILYIKVQIGL